MRTSHLESRAALRALPATLPADTWVSRRGSRPRSSVAPLARPPPDRARWRGPSGGLLLLDLGLARDQGRGDVVADDLVGDDHLGDVTARRDVVHHVEEDLLDDGAQPPGAGAALHRLVGD